MFLIAQSGEQCPCRPRFVGSWNLRVEPIRIFQTVSELDFSHLRAKGLEIRSSLPCASSADQGAYPPPPTDHNDALYGPSSHLSKSTPLPIPQALLSVGRVFAGRRWGRPRCKKSQGPS